jgi:hypothetical protein
MLKRRRDANNGRQVGPQKRKQGKGFALAWAARKAR